MYLKVTTDVLKRAIGEGLSFVASAFNSIENAVWIAMVARVSKVESIHVTVRPVGLTY